MEYRRIVCRACAVRTSGIVDPECPVCEGMGALVLSPAILRDQEPEIAGRAVNVALEAYAREAEETLDLGLDPAAVIRSAVANLRAAGLLFPPPLDAPEAAPKPPTPAPQDPAVIEAPLFEYDQDDRPGARGRPLMSESGHPSHLARLCDPADGGIDQKDRITRNRNLDRKARSVAAGAREAAKMKARKAPPQPAGLWA